MGRRVTCTRLNNDRIQKKIVYSELTYVWLTSPHYPTASLPDLSTLILLQINLFLPEKGTAKLEEAAVRAAVEEAAAVETAAAERWRKLRKEKLTWRRTVFQDRRAGMTRVELRAELNSRTNTSMIPV